MRWADNFPKIIFLFVFLFFCFSFVTATCSIGTTPLGIEASAKPGEEILVTWNFYNLYGDRITHVIINKINGPEWGIRYDPAIHEETYEVSGVTTSKLENLALEKNSVILEIPKDSPEGISYVKHPKEAGYIPVRSIKIFIKIPKDAELWKNQEFIFGAQGDCFSEPGVVIPALSTQLKVNVIPKEDFYEKNIDEKSENFFGIVTGAIIGNKNALTNGIIGTLSFFIILLLVVLMKIKGKSKKNVN